MLPCKNDKLRYYKGTEPSPKGLGWCAHAEKIDKRRKGLDGNYWIVKNNKNNIKLWVRNQTTKKCLNDDTKSYNGTEPSPRGLGWCAHAEKTETVKTGLDRNEWIVKEWSKGKKTIKKWFKVTPADLDDYVEIVVNPTSSDIKKLIEKLSESKKKIVRKLWGDIKNDLAKENIWAIPVIWKPLNNVYWSDALTNDVDVQVIKEYKGPFIIMSLKADEYGNMVAYNNKIYFSHALDLKRKNPVKSEKRAVKEIVDRVFKKYLGKRYEWSGKIKDTILII